MENNPYRSPSSVGSDHASINDKLKVRIAVFYPSMFLTIIASIAMLVDIAVITHVIFSDAPKMLYEYGNDEGLMLIVANIGGNSLLCLVHSIVLFGALNMLKLQTYSYAKLAAVLATVPFLSPVILVGIPFGIWALIILHRPGVKKAFSGGCARPANIDNQDA